MPKEQPIPFFGARRYARELLREIELLEISRDRALADLAHANAALAHESKEHKQKQEVVDRLGLLSVVQVVQHKKELERDIDMLLAKKAAMEADIAVQTATAMQHLESIKANIVVTEETALLQEVGVYRYAHPLTNAVAYQAELGRIESRIKEMLRSDGDAVLATTSWTVNGSEAQGRKMVRETAKLMLRAFNAEADNLVRTMKPHKLDSAKERLAKVSETIARLGKTMSIRISDPFFTLRVQELELTADFLHKQDEEKQAEREERERLKEERKAQLEMERERARLEKEKQHYANALEALIRKGDEEAVERMREQMADVQRAIEDVDYRAANIRAGYVYVISNIGSFGEKMVKIGMTRRLDPMDRIRELSDASVPFNFDVHALFFSKDAVTIETTMHQQFASARVNGVNMRREFFHISPAEAKVGLSALAGEILQFQDMPDAIEYRETLSKKKSVSAEMQFSERSFESVGLSARPIA